MSGKERETSFLAQEQTLVFPPNDLSQREGGDVDKGQKRPSCVVALYLSSLAQPRHNRSGERDESETQTLLLLLEYTHGGHREREREKKKKKKRNNRGCAKRCSKVPIATDA